METTGSTQRNPTALPQRHFRHPTPAETPAKRTLNTQNFLHLFVELDHALQLQKKRETVRVMWDALK
jgi:hypothetical protein